MKQYERYKIKSLIMIIVCCFLAACKISLYSGLSEKEGNEMLSILLDAKINADKNVDKDKMISLMVASEDVSKSVKLLKSYGYPKEKYSSMGDVFPKDGLISSPIEERARYTYSMSQELSSTLSMIDGVMAARVHVVLPKEKDSLNDVNYPSSASVFIKYTQDIELAGLIPKIKTLVANSIEGLSLENITVSLFPAARLNKKLEMKSSISNSLKPSVMILYILMIISLLVIFIGGFAYWWLYMRKSSQLSEQALPK